MATVTRKRRSRGLWSAFRAIWQPRTNGVPKNALSALALTPLKETNDGQVAFHQSERHEHETVTRQRVAYFVAEAALAAEFTKATAKLNQVGDDWAAMQEFLASDRIAQEAPNPRDILMALIHEWPALDRKLAEDWEAILPNKEDLPTHLDMRTANRMEFTRYLVQRGTFNEGFEDGQTPTHYRSFIDLSDDQQIGSKKELPESGS